MIKNFDVQILDLNDEPEVENDKPLMASLIVRNALFATLQEDTDGVEKNTRYELWQRIKGGGDVDITPEEIVMLKIRIGKVFNVNAVGQLYKILNA